MAIEFAKIARVIGFDNNKKRIENLDNKVDVSDFFKESIINLAVPSAVLSAMLPVNPSVTITFDSPLVILFPSMKPLNSGV